MTISAISNRSLIGIIAILITTYVVDSADEFYILIDAVNIYSCRGIANQIELTEDDVFISNEKGNKVYYVKGPGNYTLNFKRILVKKNFKHLTGEIGATLQVPVFEGPAGIRLDLPYTVIPETGLLSQQCDPNSGIVERSRRQYCRYCDMCQISQKVETGLNRGMHKFLPELARGKEEAFGPNCNKIGADTYEFKRTVRLPGRKEMERRTRKQVQGVDEEIRKRLDKGRGRFQVFLNLINSERASIKQTDWFKGSRQCRCCSASGAQDISCRVLSFLYCNKEDCKSAWAQQCLHNSAQIVACYTVEFNYRLTSDYGEVLQFLRKNKYPDQERNRPKTTTRRPFSRRPLPISQTRPRARAGATKALTTSPKHSDTTQQRCVARMPARLTHLRRYCMIFWNTKLCCTHCKDVC